MSSPKRRLHFQCCVRDLSGLNRRCANSPVTLRTQSNSLEQIQNPFQRLERTSQLQVCSCRSAASKLPCPTKTKAAKVSPQSSEALDRTALTVDQRTPWPTSCRRH